MPQKKQVVKKTEPDSDSDEVENLQTHSSLQRLQYHMFVVRYSSSASQAKLMVCIYIHGLQKKMRTICIVDVI